MSSAWPHIASAYQITGIRVTRSQEMSRLILQADGPLEFQVELKDPQTIVLHLSGASLNSPKPKLNNDPIIKDLSVDQESRGFALILKTKAPGVTVMPFYDSGTRQLTLELAGSPAFQAALKAEPKPKAKAQPKVEPKAPQKARKSPQKTQTNLKAQKPSKAAKPKKRKVKAPKVTAVRLGSHKDYSRLVIDADSPVQADFKAKGDKAYLELKNAVLLQDAKISPGDERIESILVNNQDPLSLTLNLTSDLRRHRMFKIANGNKLVLDIALRPKKQKNENKAKSGPLKNQPVSKAEKKPELPPEKTQELPIPEPNQFPKQMPEPSDQNLVAPKTALPQNQNQGSETTALPQALPKAKGKIDMAAVAQPVNKSLDKYKGKIPQVSENGEATEKKPVSSKQTSTESQSQNITAQPAPKKSLDPKSVKPGTVERFPQGAMLGDKGVEDAKARTLFENGKAALDGNRFIQALSDFTNFMKLYPNHPLAEEAAFRLADASLYLNEKNILPAYDQIMENYQRAVDDYPKSDQVPWAFAMMGEAASLAGEPHKAVGYFNLVTEDYPKSEYIPLAMSKRGAAYLAQSKYNQAIDEYRDVADKYPDSQFRQDADWGQARALFGMGRYERASLLLRDMDRRNPELRIKEPELLYYIGEAEYQLKNYQKARRYFLWALNIKPDMPFADIMLTRVGDTYQFEKDNKTARDIYRRVVEKWPETDGALVARIRLAESPQSDDKHPVDLFQIKATTDAFETYKEIAEKYPDRQVAQLATLKLGVYYFKLKDYRKSLDILQKLLIKHPRTPFKPDVEYTMNLAVMGILAQLKEKNNPLKLMEQYLRNRDRLLRPNSNQVLRLLAWAYDQAGLSARAAKLYEILMVRGVDEPEINLALTKNRMKEKEYKAVVNLMTPDELKKLKGDDLILANSLLARALANLGQCKKADRIFAKLLQKAPNHDKAPRDYLAWAKCLDKMGNYKKGLKALDAASNMLKKRKDIASGLEVYLTAMEAGSLARKANLYERAVKEFTKAQDWAPTIRERAQAIYEMAQSFKQAGKPKELAPAYQRLVKFKVAPWSNMAARHLKDMELAPRLARVGR